MLPGKNDCGHGPALDLDRQQFGCATVFAITMGVSQLHVKAAGEVRVFPWPDYGPPEGSGQLFF